MADTSDVLDAIRELLDPWHVFTAADGGRSIGARSPDDMLARLSAAGFVVVRADGLSHGDELVFVPEERPRASWWWRRSVEVNSD